MNILEKIKMNYILTLFCVVFLLGFIPVLGVAMTMYSGKSEEVVLFSPMKGTITFLGKPTSNAKIVRWIMYKDKIGEKEIFYTDDKGNFTLPLKKVSMKLSPLAQLAISQEINVFFENNDYLIWTMGKGSKDLFGELGGEPVNFVCELTDELMRVDVPNGLLGTSCKWGHVLTQP